MNFDSPELLLGFGIAVAWLTGGLSSIAERARERAEDKALLSGGGRMHDLGRGGRFCRCEGTSSSCRKCPHYGRHSYSSACDPPRSCPLGKNPRCVPTD